MSMSAILFGETVDLIYALILSLTALLEIMDWLDQLFSIMTKIIWKD